MLYEKGKLSIKQKTLKGKIEAIKQMNNGIEEIEKQMEEVLEKLGTLPNERDRLLEETKREFNEWLTTLCKRVLVDKCLVEITNDFGSKRELINKDFKDLEELFEEPSWMNETSKNWCEKIMWEDKERP